VNRFVAQFVGTVNLFEGELREGTTFASPALGTLRLPAAMSPGFAGAADLAFRPHAVHLLDGDAAESERAGDDESLRLEGRVAGAEFLGEAVRYELRVGAATIIADCPHRRGQDRLADGAAVQVQVAASEMRLMPRQAATPASDG
jgi:iron(III) transport system ATP-binding protein